jgi:uncharacterized protein (DUF433 family)
MGVHSLIKLNQACQGDDERILREFPHLCREQIDAALEYYQVHRERIDAINEDNRRCYEEGLARQQATRG